MKLRVIPYLPLHCPCCIYRLLMNQLRQPFAVPDAVTSVIPGLNSLYCSVFKCILMNAHINIRIGCISIFYPFFFRYISILFSCHYHLIAHSVQLIPYQLRNGQVHILFPYPFFGTALILTPMPRVYDDSQFSLFLLLHLFPGLRKGYISGYGFSCFLLLHI